MESIITPVKVDVLQKLLLHYKYDKVESEFLVNGFRHGFEIGFDGDRDVRKRAPNLKLEVGTPTDLWNKVMKY